MRGAQVSTSWGSVGSVGLTVALCSCRERQEQLMGYRKRGPKPKPLVMQVSAGGAQPHAPGQPVCSATCPQGAACSGFHHAEELLCAAWRLAVPWGRVSPALSSSGAPSPRGGTMQPSPQPPRAAGQTHGTGGWAALAGCLQAVQQQPCLVPVPRQLIEGCFSSFHCFINLEQCTACKWERAGALRCTERAVLQPGEQSHGRGGHCTAAPSAYRSTGALLWVPG